MVELWCWQGWKEGPGLLVCQGRLLWNRSTRTVIYQIKSFLLGNLCLNFIGCIGAFTLSCSYNVILWICSTKVKDNQRQQCLCRPSTNIPRPLNRLMASHLDAVRVLTWLIVEKGMYLSSASMPRSRPRSCLHRSSVDMSFVQKQRTACVTKQAMLSSVSWLTDSTAARWTMSSASNVRRLLIRLFLTICYRWKPSLVGAA